MKRLFLLMSCAMLLSACKTPTPMPEWKPVARTTPQDTLYDSSGNVIERIPFRAGVSSVTVENMAKREGCVGGQGAGLMTPQGPVEVYRMICESRRVYVAKCEFRQCKSVNPTPAGGYATPRPQVVMPVEPAQVASSPVAAPAGNNMTVIAVPADSNIKVVSAPALGARGEVPKLAIKWACGDCTVNDKVAPIITAAYQREAAARGYSVSTTATAEMSIVRYRQRPPAVRALFGIMAGKDHLGTTTVMGGKKVDAYDYSANAWFGMNSLAESVAKKTVAQWVK